MKKILPLILLTAISFSVNAQQAPPVEQPYGKVDNADLEMKSCDFEKDANAEKLIDKAELYFDDRFNIVTDYHERIKIFNDNGKDVANIHLPFFAYRGAEYITGLQAETINLNDGKVEITKLDKKQVYTKVIDKYKSELVFSMPDVKAGSIIDYKYIFTSTEFGIPTWYFQSDRYPVKFSEFITNIPEYFYFSMKGNNRIPLAINTTTQNGGSIGSGADRISFNVETQTKAMTNLPSLPDEPYMSSIYDNLQSLQFHLTSFRPPYGFTQTISDTWAKVGGNLADDEDFGGQLKRKLKDEEAIITAAKALKTDDEKIAYIFNAVQSTMKWNGFDDWYTIDGTAEAWDKKTGNSTEINLILYHLLKKAGVKSVMPMLVSTRNHGKVNMAYTSVSQFNRAVVYIPVDSTKRYILDATGKYNMYNETPYNLLNSSGLFLDMDSKTFDLLFVDRLTPVRQSVFINAEIKPDGKLAGTAQISSQSYNRIENITKYKDDGEKKYIDYLIDADNNLKISSLKMENMEVDSLPLMEHVDFNLDLAGSDDNYIYLNPNLFSGLHVNPFLSESRSSDIDFGCLNNLFINGMYKIPAGFKTDALPKSVSMSMPDGSIVFKRFVAEQDGTLVVRFSISYKKTIYFKENYDDFHEFFKKMYEMMNEQVVLKKS